MVNACRNGARRLVQGKGVAATATTGGAERSGGGDAHLKIGQLLAQDDLRPVEKNGKDRLHSVRTSAKRGGVSDSWCGVPGWRKHC